MRDSHRVQFSLKARFICFVVNGGHVCTDRPGLFTDSGRSVCSASVYRSVSAPQAAASASVFAGRVLSQGKSFFFCNAAYFCVCGGVMC